MSVLGYHGQYLRVDLTAGEHRRVPLDPTTLRSYLGGSGLGAWLLLQEDAPELPATEAPLAFVFSPLVGSPLTTSAKFAVVGKSPLTGRFNDALASSRFALLGKATGFDALVLHGAAEQPSVLVIDEQGPRLESAGDLWGLGIREAEARLRTRFGREYAFAVIGPAGERQVRFASLSHDGRHAGRGGNGAVLGGKRIKAVAVRGDRKVAWHDPAGLVRYAKELSARSFGPATAKYRELGTASNLLAFNRLNTLPTLNFQQGSFSGAEQLAPETLRMSRGKIRKSCAACTIGCEHLYQLEGQENHVRLEYENLFALGPLCGVSDPETVLRASQRCDDLGLDTISTGGTIAFAMECVQRGLLAESWLTFGSTTALMRAIKLIGAREGIGDLLAEGSRRMGAHVGGVAPGFAMHVKGLELPGYEPRTLQTMALGLAVGTRGADHNRSSAYEVDFTAQSDRREAAMDSVHLAVQAEDRAALVDSLILCKFLRHVFPNVWQESASMLHWVTGWELDERMLQETARRIISAKKQFNVRAGWTPEEDTLPDRFFQDALPEDSARLSRKQLQSMIETYNLARGWTKDGYPRDSGAADSLPAGSTCRP